MAKGKNAAALFEVIHTDKRFGKSKDPAEKLSTPKWWFKGRPKAEPAPVDPTVGAAARRAAAAAAAAAEPPPVFVPPDPGPPPAPEVAAAEPQPYDPTEHALRSLSALSSGSMPAAASHARRSDDDDDDRDSRVAVDPDRGEIRLKLTYTSAIIGMFAIVVVLGLAYVLGRHLSRGPTPVLANSGEIRRGPVQPGVLDVGSAAPVSANTPAAVSQGNTRPPAQLTTPTPVPPRATDPGAPQPPDTLVLDDGHRRIGMQYVVVQSWPPEEKQLAEEAVKTLTNNGIGATLESGLPYAPRWVSVVGMKGFDRTQGSAEYSAYIQKIMQVSDKFAGTKKWKAFDPKSLTWKEVYGR
jgi:hypothetical protein